MPKLHSSARSNAMVPFTKHLRYIKTIFNSKEQKSTLNFDAESLCCA